MHQHLHPARPHALPEVVERIIEEFVERNAIPGATLAITTPDGATFAGAHGHRDLATDATATADTSYLWFSLTKVVTATAVRRLADEGRLDLDAPAADLVPALLDSARGGGPGPTVRQLLTHTAGLSNPVPIRWVTAGAADDASADDLLERLLAKRGRTTKPTGGPARYSNLGYLVLGAVVEAATGEPFTRYVERAVLEPLGMDHTAFAHVDPDLAATGYVQVPRPVTPLLRAVLSDGIVGPRVQGRTALNPFTVLGPSYGGLVGPATDAARFAAMHLGDGELDGVRVLRPETAEEMRSISAFGRRRDFGNAWFASAEHRSATPRYVEHLGAGGGFYNAMRIYPDRGIGMVLMTNTTKAYDHHALFSRLLELE